METGNRLPLLVFLTITLFASESLALPRLFPGNQTSLLAFISHYCQGHRYTCVLDMTIGPPLCKVSPYYFQYKESVVDVSAELSRQCPGYKLAFRDDILFVAPAQSALNAMVGPVDRREMPSVLLGILMSQSKLDKSVGGGIPEGLQPIRRYPPIERRYRLPRDTFMANIVRAAKITGPSFWAVIRHENGSFETTATDFSD